MKASLSRILICLFLSSFGLVAQTNINISNELNGIVVKFKKVLNREIGTEVYYDMGGMYHVGRQSDTALNQDTTAQDTYRSEFKFDLTAIPSNATISGVTLNASFNSSSGSYTYSIKSTSGNNSYYSLWDEIGTASSLFSNLGFNMSHSKTSATLTALVQSSLSTGEMFLSVKANNEDIDGTGGSGSMSLSISYIVPVNITITNKMGTNNSGSIGVGINESPQTKDSPHPITPFSVKTLACMQ